MATDIVIQVGDEEFTARLSPERSPQTVDRILSALPIEAQASTWGDEVYFPIPVVAEAEDAVARVSVGDLAYWPEGHCFCIFYGRTPMSGPDGVPIPASRVNLVGTIDHPERLRAHRSGESVSIRAAR